MDVVEKMIQDVQFAIPQRILDEVFIRRQQTYRNQPTTVADQIKHQVFYARMYVDMKIVGGTEMLIQLDTLEYEQVDQYKRIYWIPKSVTNGRNIVSVKNMTYGNLSTGSSYGQNASISNSTLLQGGQAMFDAHGAIPNISTSRVELIGPETVMVSDNRLIPSNVFLRCVLDYDRELSDINIRLIHKLSKGLLFAVKAYIYRTMIVEMDVGQLYAGQQLGAFKQIIDSYADAEENYQQYVRETLQKLLMMNDNDQMHRHLMRMAGGYR